MQPRHSPRVIKIAPDQRAAIYADAMNHLSGIGDIYIKVEKGEFATAQRLRREFEDDMRLLDDVGWVEEIEAESFELTMPLDSLARPMERLHSEASSSLRTLPSELGEQRIGILRTGCSAYAEVLGRIAEIRADVEGRA
jgi:hypothetical protein